MMLSVLFVFFRVDVVVVLVVDDVIAVVLVLFSSLFAVACCAFVVGFLCGLWRGPLREVILLRLFSTRGPILSSLLIQRIQRMVSVRGQPLLPSFISKVAEDRWAEPAL